ncbi:hypothetical protein WJ96_06835 [Burkholderia ubonensis]|uniref:Glutamyl-tRNA amidotransferase n=1 Tax=Burkholderia ubonensis TaxID=101571 RepID=A0AAW3MZJ3_9BURK|nr:GatB/YqeY domain-containing protein [Burkholderia ubonensis]KVP98232.1 hypothetical protein WJ96_06835 [Burkholderia ubonensis]KVZ92929.1 hypothetical protein WL25_18495 [Burkholderia ubonensis]
MTTLIERIRQDALAARKARETEKGIFLITLLAEAAKVGKDDGNRESTDAEVTAIIKKFIKNTDKTLRALGDKAPDSRARLEAELAILQAYLPRQATEDEVRTAVGRYVAELAERNPKQMGVVMGKLNAEFDGNFDKGLASKLVKEALAG